MHILQHKTKDSSSLYHYYSLRSLILTFEILKSRHSLMEINAEKKNFPLSASPVPKSNFPLRERDKERERETGHSGRENF